jgi:hypothetical protein
MNTVELEELSGLPGAPELVITEAVPTSGLDLLGLRVPAETVANSLLDGITTVTPTVRYLGVRAWIIWRYGQLNGLDSIKEFMAFANKVECALVLGNLLNDPSTPGLVGQRSAGTAIKSGEDPIELRSLAKIPAMRLYAGPSEALEIGWGGTRLPGITNERGLPLVESVHEKFLHSKVLMSITPNGAPQSFSRDELKTIGQSFSMRNPSGEERELLVEFIIPEQPNAKEIPRVATYCLILHLCQQAGKQIEEEDIIRTAISPDISLIPSELHTSTEGWARFAVRDMLVAVHEAAVAIVNKHIFTTSAGTNRKSIDIVLAELTSEDLAKGIALFGFSTDLINAPIRDFCAAVNGRLKDICRVGNINRWHSDLDELAIIRASKPLSAAMVILPLAWWLAARRMEPGIHDEIPEFDLEGNKASARIGVRDVIFTEINEWAKSNETVRDVVSRLLARSVDQHLRIAWSRLAREPWKDVSVLGSDGDDWLFCQDFKNGRATSRLYQAINWLQQLGLITATGVTQDGLEVLNTRLAVLKQLRNQTE